MSCDTVLNGYHQSKIEFNLHKTPIHSSVYLSVTGKGQSRLWISVDQHQNGCLFARFLEATLIEEDTICRTSRKVALQSKVRHMSNIAV